jgi:hypothetical protein
MCDWPPCIKLRMDVAMDEPTYFGKVSGSEPEHFCLTTMHTDHRAVKHMSFFTEAEFREFCRISGEPGPRPDEVDSIIEAARKHEAT